MKRTILTLLFVAAIAAAMVPSQSATAADTWYEVITATANGPIIRISIAAEGTGLGVTLAKSGKDGKGTSFVSQGEYYIDGISEYGQEVTWGPYFYDSNKNNRGYHNMLWPAEQLGHGRSSFRIRLYSADVCPMGEASVGAGNCTSKVAAYAIAFIHCPDDWQTGLNECD